MGLLVYLVLLAVSGLFVGAFGRLALPGPDPMSVGQTIAVGLAGSFLAGLVSWGLFGEHHGGGVLLSIVFAAAIVYMVRRGRGGGLMDPGGRSDKRR